MGVVGDSGRREGVGRRMCGCGRMICKMTNCSIE